MKRNLVLMTGVALIVLMTLSVMAFSWPWQATGKASETIWYGPYKVYDGNPREIQVGNNKYNVAVEEVLDLSTASLNFAGTTLQVSEGLISPVGNLQIKIKEVSNKKGIFSKPFVSFSVAEAENKISTGTEITYMDPNNCEDVQGKAYGDTTHIIECTKTQAIGFIWKISCENGYSPKYQWVTKDRGLNTLPNGVGITCYKNDTDMKMPMDSLIVCCDIKKINI